MARWVSSRVGHSNNAISPPPPFPPHPQPLPPTRRLVPGAHGRSLLRQCPPYWRVSRSSGSACISKETMGGLGSTSAAEEAMEMVQGAVQVRRQHRPATLPRTMTSVSCHIPCRTATPPPTVCDRACPSRLGEGRAWTSPLVQPMAPQHPLVHILSKWTPP